MLLHFPIQNERRRAAACRAARHAAGNRQARIVLIHSRQKKVGDRKCVWIAQAQEKRVGNVRFEHRIRPAEERRAVGGFFQLQMKRVDRDIIAPSRPPESDRLAILDFLGSADDRFAEDADQGLGIQMFLKRLGDLVGDGCVVRRVKDNCQIRSALKLVANIVGDFFSRPRGVFGRR